MKNEKGERADASLYSGNTLTTNFTTQFFFEETITDQVYQTAPYNTRTARDTRNASDNVYTGGSMDGTVSSNAGCLLMLRISKNAASANASFPINLR